MPADPSETLSIDDDALTRPFLFTMWVVWGALLVSVAGYVVVGHLVALPGPPAAPVAIVYALAAAGLGCAVAAVVVRQKLLPPTAPPGGPGVIRRDAATRALVPYFSAQIVALALFDAIAVLGLVATFVRHDPRCVDGFAAVAALGILLVRPSAERVRGTLRAAAAQGA